VYVDDIIVTSSKPQAVTTLLKKLGGEFALNDLGNLHYFCGIAVNQTKDGIILSQDKYASDLLKKAGKATSKLVSAPLATGNKLPAHIGTPLDSNDSTHYRSIVGALQYLTFDSS
jgi:hypothetical protein